MKGLVKKKVGGNVERSDSTARLKTGKKGMVNMKKICTLTLIAMMIFGMLMVSAAEEPQIKLHAIDEKYVEDLDGSGTKSTVEIQTVLNEYGDGDITVIVNDQSFTLETCFSVAESYATVQISDQAGGVYTLIMPYEYGPSDDPITYMFMYREGVLHNLGSVPAALESIAFDENGAFSATIRARLLGTWYRQVDYIIASAFYWDETSGQTVEEYLVTEVPRDVYPMGQIVTLKKKLPVLASRYDTEPSKTLLAGEKAIISATDDCRWLYIVDAELGEGGWVKMQGEYSAMLQIGEGWAEEYEVFDGLVYAD